MTATYASVASWWVKHQTITAIGTVVLSLLVSVYSQEVRRVLHWPFRFMGKRIAESIAGQAKARDSYLEFIRDDAYKAVLFIAWYVLHSIISSFFWSVAASIMFTVTFRIPIGVLPLFAGILMGDAVKLRFLLREAMGW